MIRRLQKETLLWLYFTVSDMLMNASNLDKKQIERVAVEYNQMQHLVNRGKGLPFVVENEWVRT